MRSRPRSPALGGLACFAVLAAIGLLSHLSARIEALDADLLEVATRVRGEPWIDRGLEALVHLGDPAPYLLVALAIVAAAWAKGGLRAAVVLGAPCSSSRRSARRSSSCSPPRRASTR